MKRDPVALGALMAFVIALVPYALPLGPDAMTVYAGQLAEMFLMAVTIVVILVTRARLGDQVERRFWGFIAAAFGAWFVARNVHVLSQAVLGIDASLLADVLYLHFFVFFLLALEVRRQPGDAVPSSCPRANLVSMGRGVLLVGILAYFTVVPAIFAREAYDSWIPNLLQGLVLDGYLFVRLMTLQTRSQATLGRITYGWLAAALGLWWTIGLAELLGALDVIPSIPLGTPLDFAWYAPFAGVMIASRLSVGEGGSVVSDVSPSVPSPDDERVLWDDPLVLYAFALPVLHFAFNAFGVLDGVDAALREGVVLATVVVLVGLTVRYEVLVRRENRALSAERAVALRSLQNANERLERRVESRTVELKTLNASLVRDIEQRQEAERALRSSERRHRALLDAIPDMIFRIGRDGTFRDFVPAPTMEPLRPVEQFLGKRVADTLPEPVATRSMQFLEEAFLTGEVQEFEYPLELGGESRNFEARIVATADDEAVGIVRDVTEHRRAQEALQRTQKLESLGVLAGGIAHDFNNLLGAIVNYSAIATMDLAPGSEPAAAVEDIRRTAMQASELTQKMLAYAGLAHVKKRDLDVRDVVSGVRGFTERAVAKKTRLVFDLADGVPLVSGDATQLTQIVLNLIINGSEALENTPGTVTVEIGYRRFDEAFLGSAYMNSGLRAGSYVYLSVEDSGKGIPDHVRNRVFDPFFTTKFTGRGLGLAAVLGIVRSHNGAVHVRSAPNRGSTFTVILPASWKAIARQPVSGDAPAEEWTGSGTILLVDDEPDVRTSLKQLLQRWGFDVATATNGREGLDLFHTLRGTLRAVLLDHSMPEMDGRETLGALRALDSDTPVILLSGYAESEVMKQFRDLRLSGFLHKPFAPLALREKLQMVLGTP